MHHPVKNSNSLPYNVTEGSLTRFSWFLRIKRAPTHGGHLGNLAHPRASCTLKAHQSRSAGGSNSDGAVLEQDRLGCRRHATYTPCSIARHLIIEPTRGGLDIAACTLVLHIDLLNKGAAEHTCALLRHAAVHRTDSAPPRELCQLEWPFSPF